MPIITLQGLSSTAGILDAASLLDQHPQGINTFVAFPKPVKI
jgi:hypothetical protein